MASLNMKPSDIRIVSSCLDYMQILDVQGEISHKDENVSFSHFPFPVAPT